MTMQSDVNACSVAGNAPTYITPNRCRIKALHITYTSTPGYITLYNTVNGQNKIYLTVDTPPAAGALYMLLPGEGILAEEGLYAASNNGIIGTVFYG